MDNMMHDGIDGPELRSFLKELTNELELLINKKYEIDSIHRLADNITTWGTDGSGLWFMTVTDKNNNKTTLHYRDETVTISNWITWKKVCVSLYDNELYTKIVNGIREVWDNGDQHA